MLIFSKAGKKKIIVKVTTENFSEVAPVQACS